MYDTVVLKSPELDVLVAEKIKTFCNQYEGKVFETDELLYSFTRGKLEGSYDYRIRIQVDNTEFVYDESSGRPGRRETYWHIIVECSVHKLLMGHNVYGGPTDIHKSILYLVRFLEKSMCVNLPEYKFWEIRQVDVSKIFKFSSEDLCRRIVSNLENSYYTRRMKSKRTYGTSVMFPGSTTTCKFYMKGAEFEKHDYRRVMKYINKQLDKACSSNGDDSKNPLLLSLKEEFDKVLNLSKRILRFECAIKLRKLKDLFGTDVVYVGQLRDDILYNCMETELRKLIKEDDSKMEIVRRSDLVLERLRSVTTNSMANILYSMWCQIVQFGEEKVRSEMPKTTFYRQRKLLIEYGCSWNASVVNLKQISLVPADFTFTNNNYVDNSVSSVVKQKLENIA